MKQNKNRILFINPNRYRNPPVIPLGIEYLVHSLKSNHFEVDVLDLCFSDQPLQDLDQAVREVRPRSVCMTIRNVDSVLYPDTDYFLPEIKRFIRHIRGLTNAPVIIGGSALPADATGVLNFLGADVAIQGPGEETLVELLRDEIGLKEKGRVIRGVPPASFCPERGQGVSYGPYLEKDGLPGFETHKGCSSDCGYCMEAGTPVRFKEPSDVLCELKQLVDRGFKHLHLCDSEFNEDLDYCLSLLKGIAREKPAFKWGLYMKPGNYNQRLIELLRVSGAYLVTLSVDTLSRPTQYWKDVETMVSLCRQAGIRVSIDFLTGFPHEDDDSLRKSFDFFSRILPDEVVVNVFLRLYRNIRITKAVHKDPSLRKFLILPERSDVSLLTPVFYNHVPLERLRELIGGDSLFRIAGAEKVVNYQKAR